MHARLFALAVLIGSNAVAVPVTVRDPEGKPIATVMVSRSAGASSSIVKVTRVAPASTVFCRISRT